MNEIVYVSKNIICHYLFKEVGFDCFTLMGLFTCLKLNKEFRTLLKYSLSKKKNTS